MQTNNRFTYPFVIILPVFLALMWVYPPQVPAFSPPRPITEGSGFPDFPESVFTRRSYYDRITGPVSEALRVEEDLVDEPGEKSMVGVSVERGEEEIRFYFSSTGDLSPESARRGDYEILRDKSEGEFISLKIHLKSGEDSYLLLQPENEDYSRMDVYLLGSRFQRDIRVPYEFKELLRTSFASLMKSTAGYVDWEFYLPDPIISELSTGEAIAKAVRSYLPGLADVEDGAIDQKGNYVYIDDGSPQEGEGGLNCSGFAKWVVDGIYSTKTGSLLPIEILKKTHPDIRGHRWSAKYEDERQPYFGLDWTRNLAFAMKRLRESGADIRSADVDKLTYHEYKENVGFAVESLGTLLYELAVREPEHFYLGSVNGLDEEGELRTHYHVAVLFSWIDKEGRLGVSVMERGVETPLERFIEKYKGEFIHLVRIKGTGSFSPPVQEPDPSLNR
ncbi:MAG: hypothetical protein ACLFMZ_09600 [Spirochaetaceae bacterium]